MLHKKRLKPIKCRTVPTHLSWGILGDIYLFNNRFVQTKTLSDFIPYDLDKNSKDYFHYLIIERAIYWVEAIFKQCDDSSNYLIFY